MGVGVGVGVDLSGVCVCIQYADEYAKWKADEKKQFHRSTKL